MADENYEQLTKKQLIELCKQRECKGYSNLKKAELIEKQVNMHQDLGMRLK